MPPLDTAVDTLIAQGVSDDDIRSVIAGIRQQTENLINQGKTDEEIESTISQTRWKNIPLFASKPATPTAQPTTRPTANRAENLTPEQKEQFRKRTEGEGLEEPSFASELVNPINLLTGGINSLVSRGVGKVLGNTVMQRTPGVVREAVDWQTMGLSNVPAAAKKVYQGYKAAPKTMADKAAALEASGAKLVPGTGKVAPNVTGYVEDIRRPIVTPGKGTVGAYTDDLAAQLEQQDYIRQSPLGKLALEADLAAGRGSIVDPEVTFNINNASLRHLETQLETITRQHDDLFKSIGQMKEGSRAPARNVLARIFQEKQAVQDEITNLRMQQNQLMPQIGRKLTAEKTQQLADQQAMDIRLREAEQTNILAKEVLQPTVDKPLPMSTLPLDPTKMTPEQAAAQRAIDEEVIKRGREYLSDTITPADLDLKDIPGGWYSGTPDAKPLNWYIESNKLDKLRNKMVLDVGSTVRLSDNEVGTIAGLRQDGMVRVVTKSGTNKGKEVLLSPQQTYGSILRDVTGEPEITGKTLKNGKINFTGNSGLTHKQAYDKLDTPSLTRDEVQVGDDIATSIAANKSNGLSSMNHPPAPPPNARNGPIIDAARSTGTQGPTAGQVSPNPPLGPKTNIGAFAFKFRPTWRVAAELESRTGIPTFTKLYRYGREASDNYMHMKLDWGDRIDQVFKEGKIYHFSKANKAAQSRVTEYLEKINSSDVNTPLGMLANKLHGKPSEVKVAVELRKLYDEAAAQGAIDPTIYTQYYSPRRTMPDEPLFEFLKKRTTDYMPFFQHPRTGNLLPREDNALILSHKYFDTWSRNKHLTPWYENIASPMLNNAEVIPNDTTRNYFTNYMFDVMRYPRQSAVETNDRMYTLVNNTIGKIYGNQQLADDILAKFGQERMGEVLSDKMLSLQYKTFLGFRPIPAVRNATQKLFGLPFLSEGHLPFSAEGNLLKGWSLAKTKDGKEKVLASGIGGGYQELSGVAERVGRRLTSPMHAYQKAEISNRASIYLPIHDRVLQDFKDGKKISDVSKHINLHLYPEVIQNEFKRLYNAGAVRDVRSGTGENAAHFLGDWAQLMTQFPYEKGGGPEAFRASPIARQFGAFQSWTLFTADYLGNLAKDVIQHPVQQRQKLYALGKMYAYYTMLDTMMENALGIDFHSNPLSSAPTTILGSPSASAVEAIMKTVNAEVRQMQMTEMQKRSDEYKRLDRESAEGLKTLMNLPVPGIVRDINKLTGEKNILDSTKKIVGID